MNGAGVSRSRRRACRLCGGTVLVHGAKTGRARLEYLACTDCGCIALSRKCMLSKADERARYGEHRNSDDNEGYRRFLDDFVDTAVLPWIGPGSSILDFGSGPEPVLAQLLRRKGYECDIHDPMFARTRLWKRKIYDAILLHEVAEHFRDPATSFQALASCIRPGGILAIRTRFAPDLRKAAWPAEFDSWWYRMDRTHVAFYRPGSILRFLEPQGFSPVLVKEPDMLVLACSLTG